MKNRLYCKILVVEIIVLFVGVSVLPSISGNIKKTNNIENIHHFIIPPDEEWNKTFGGTSYDGCYSIQQTTEEGYILLGYTRSFGAGDFDIWLTKTDVEGNHLWNKTFGGTGYDYGRSVQQTKDEGYIIVGYTFSYGNGESDIWLIKTDSDGNKVWDKTFGGAKDDRGYSIRQTIDEGYIITGYSRSSGTGGADVWLIKTDNNGNHLWNKTFGGTSSEEGFSVQPTIDEGYIISGYTVSYGVGDSDIWLIKTDSYGNKIWEKTFGGTNADFSVSVMQTTDEGYIITGGSESYGNGESDIWLIKTDSNGNHQWNKTFGGSAFDFGWSVQQTSDEGYILTGGTDSYSVGEGDIWLIKTDSNGNHLWNKTFGGSDHDWGHNVQQTSDEGYIITGYTYSFGAGESDVWMIKVESKNHPPDKPDTPWKKAKPTKSSTYSTRTDDPDEDQVWFLWDWDDGTNSGWLGPFKSGDVASATHIWSEAGEFSIRVKAKDDFDAESEWSDPLEVTVTLPRSRTFHWMRFLDMFPVVQRIIKLLM